MAVFTALSVANHNHPTTQKPVANDALLTIILPCVWNLKDRTREDMRGISEIKSAPGQCLVTFDWIERDTHKVIVCTLNAGFKRQSSHRLGDVVIIFQCIGESRFDICLLS